MRKILLTGALIGMITVAQSQTPHVFYAQKSTIHLIHVSKPLREIPSAPLEQYANRKEKDNPTLEHPTLLKPQDLHSFIVEDKALQKEYSDTSTVLNVLSNWAGLSTSVDPSDNTLAVSPEYVVQVTNNWSNSSLRIWNKAGDVLATNINSEDLTGIADYGDPNIIYDEAADRFVMCFLKATGSKLIIAISATNDPMGVWYAYSFSTPGGFPDYPKISVWGDTYFITTNSNVPTVWGLDRTALLAGDAIGDVQQFTVSGLGTISFESLAPVTVTGGTLPDTDEPAVFVRVADDAWMGVDADHMELFYCDIDWDDPGLSTLSGPFDLDIIDYNSYMCGYNSWNCIDQPGVQKLDPLGNIVMDKAQYRRFEDHASIVCSHVVNADGEGTAGVRWYELRKDAGTWYVYQQGTYAPNDTHHRWMSSVSINQFGNIALGYNISSETVYPGIRVTGRSACDSLGVMSAEEANVQDGAGSNNTNRYGDYNALVCDPSDGSFWLTANYNPNVNWSTRVIHFALDSCTTTTPVDTTQDTTIQSFIDPALFITELQITPNPADISVHITYTMHYAMDVLYSVRDISGKEVFHERDFVPAGNVQYTMQTKNYPEGAYVVTIRMGEATVHRKLIIQH